MRQYLADGTAAVTDLICTGEDIANVTDEELVSAAMSGLRLLARHARDRAGAGGSVSLRATITPIPGVQTRLVHFRHHGLERPLRRALVDARPVATALADLDDLVERGAALLAATHGLVTGLMQEFGYPEVLQVSPEGQVRRLYWMSEVHGRLQQWAEGNGVDVIDDVIDR